MNINDLLGGLVQSGLSPHGKPRQELDGGGGILEGLAGMLGAAPAKAPEADCSAA